MTLLTEFGQTKRKFEYKNKNEMSCGNKNAKISNWSLNFVFIIKIAIQREYVALVETARRSPKMYVRDGGNNYGFGRK